MLVVCGEIPDRHLETPPALVVEILSESTRQGDCTYKRDLYESEGVAVYLIADPDARTLEVLVRSDAGKYEVVSSNGPVELRLCEDCEITLDFSSLF